MRAKTTSHNRYSHYFKPTFKSHSQKLFLLKATKKAGWLLFLLISLSCFFWFKFFSYTWFKIFLILFDITNNTIFLAFSLKSLNCVIKAFVFANFNYAHCFHLPLWQIICFIIPHLLNLSIVCSKFKK